MGINVDRRALGQAISGARKNRGISQQRLADLLGDYQTTVSRIERGAGVLTFDKAVALCSLLDIELNDLATFVNSPSPPCDTCFGWPPVGFTCQTCGASKEVA